MVTGDHGAVDAEHVVAGGDNAAYALASPIRFVGDEIGDRDIEIGRSSEDAQSLLRAAIDDHRRLPLQHPIGLAPPQRPYWAMTQTSPEGQKRPLPCDCFAPCVDGSVLARAL